MTGEDAAGSGGATAAGVGAGAGLDGRGWSGNGGAVAAGVHSVRARPALVWLAAADPTLAALALWCAHRDADTVAAARTEGTTILYGPAFEALPAHEQVGLAAHHVLHVALRHGPRMGGMAGRLGPAFDARLYNLAADALVNEVVLAAGYALPRPAVTLTDLLVRVLGQPPGPDALALWDVDRLYLRLAGMTRGQHAQGTGASPRNDAAKAGAASRGGQGAADNGEGGAEAARAAGAGNDDAARAPEHGAPEHGAPEPGAPEPGDDAAGRALLLAEAAGFAPDLAAGTADAENPDGAEDAALWRQHLARALEAGRLAGRGVGMFAQRLADLPQPHTPWELVLRRLLTRALLPGRTQSHHRPARDWIAADALARSRGGPEPVFRPGLRRLIPAPRVALAIDASGSISNPLLQRFLSEVCGIARRVAAEITLIAFDDAVRWQLRLDPVRWRAQVAALDWPRGGGTDLGPPVAAAVALRASVAVVLTDLDGPFGPPPRGLPVIWAVPDGEAAPPFGHRLSLAR